MPQLAPLIYLSLGGQFEADGKGSICPIIQQKPKVILAEGRYVNQFCYFVKDVKVGSLLIWESNFCKS